MDQEVEELRINRAFMLSIGGIGMVVMLVIILVFVGEWGSSDVASVAGLFTSLLGTIVGAFFGLQIGASGKEDAERRAEKSERKFASLAAVSSKDGFEDARNLDPDPWQ
jgi:hypothetical protein